jgi:hypothetical protein
VKYRTPREFVMQEYADVLTMRRLRKKREEKLGHPIPKSKITDNSEPWLQKPSSIADCLWINEQVTKLSERYAPQS